MSNLKSKNKPDKSKSPPPLTICYTNVRGLRGNFTDLEAFMLKNKPDIFALCETNLHEDVLDADVQLPGYLPIHRKDSGNMHGLGVYVKSNLPIAREYTLEDEKESFMCFRLALLHTTTYIFFLYRSPSSSSCSVIEAVSSNIDKALIHQPSANIMVCGDFNAHNTEWLSHSRAIDVAGVSCFEFALAHDITQIVDFPTRIPDRDDHQPYLLDLFLCSIPDLCTVISHPPLGKSDHMVVGVDVNFVVKSANEHPYHRTVYSYCKADWDGLRDHLRDVPWLDIFKHNATFAAKEISEWIEIGIDCYIPHHKFQLKPHSSPWFTPSCAAAIAHRNHIFHQYHRNMTPENKKLFCDSRNHCKRVLEEAKSKYAEATRCSIASQSIGSRDFWRISNSILNRGKSTIPPLFNGPEVLTTATDKANLFARNFSKNSTLDDSSQVLPDFPSRTEQRLSSRKITSRMVAKVIHNLDTFKATGPDRIPSIVLKMCSSELSPVLAKLYNRCLTESCFPSCWKSSSVVPAFKNDGERSDPGNYRPISLLPIISKIFESFINDSLIKHLDGTSLFSDLQYGFRAFRSTADLLTVLSERIYNSLDAGGETRAIALDISKAFDKVWHAGLLHKLKAYGVDGSILSIIESFLLDRALKVVLDGHSSPLYNINAGVPQGSVLGPTLFLVFINDLPDGALSRIGIYADDTTVYSSVGKSGVFEKVESAAELQDDLRGIVEWGNRWLVSFNATKTKLLSFHRHRDPSLVPVEMNGIALPEKTSFRLLGITFTPSMDWKPYIQSIAKAASRRVGSLYRAQRFLTPETILHLYKSTIRPCMEYCSHIWGGAPKSHGLDLLDRVQKRVVNLVGPELSAGLNPLSHRRDVASLSLFYKYYNGNCSSELVNLVPCRRVTVRTTRFSERLHPHAVDPPKCRTKFYQSSFFPRTAKLWNSLAVGCFPSEYNLTAFKAEVNKFLLLK